MFVLDTSVTMAWCFEDEADARADAVLDRLRTEPAAAPDLWPLEVANVLLVAERTSRITEAQSTHFLALLGALPIQVEASPDWTELLAAGRRHGLSAYDASYLTLAARLGAPLATLDGELAAACSAAGVATVIVGET